MAEKDDIEITEESSGKSKLMIIIIAVLALALIGMGVMLFMGDNKSAEAPGEEIATPVKQAPVYAEIPKPLIVNFSKQSKGTVRYLSIKIKVMARSEDVIDAFKLHTPAIQHELLMLFFGQKYDDLNTTKGIKTLKQSTLNTINKVLRKENAGEIEAVYFTNLIMQ